MRFFKQKIIIGKKGKFLEKHWKSLLISLIFIVIVGLGTAGFFIFNPRDIQAAGIQSIIPNKTTGPFGGQINFTLDCSSKSTCLQNPICTIVNCILQTPFTLHIFQNYVQSKKDAFSTLRDNVLEPQELKNCMPIMLSYAPLMCPLINIAAIVGPSSLFVECGCTSVNCKTLCPGFMAILQAANVSPAGLKVKALQQVTSGGKPGIVLVLYPNQGMPACNGQGFVIGTGYGQGLYFTFPNIHSVGDSCRGSYY